MEDQFYTAKEVAKTLKVAYMTVYRWIKAGKLKAYQMQKQYRVKASDLNNFIESQKIK